MNDRLKDLISKFVESLNKVKEDIFSLTIHGSSVYSLDLKNHQDITILS